MAVRSKTNLVSQAETIRDETGVKANTKTRVYDILNDLIDTFFGGGMIPKVVDNTNVNAYVGSPGFDSLVDGQLVMLEVLAPNTSASPTLNLDSLGAKEIKGPGGETISDDGGVLTANQTNLLVYDGTNDEFRIIAGSDDFYRYVVALALAEGAGNLSLSDFGLDTKEILIQNSQTLGGSYSLTLGYQLFDVSNTDASGNVFFKLLSNTTDGLKVVIVSSEEAKITDESDNVRGFYHALPSHTVVEANALATAYKQPGVQIWVSDETGGACVAVWDGSNWVRIRDNVTIS